ncbi:MAG: FAD-binding oxidoreductase [Roseovarius sp.]
MTQPRNVCLWEDTTKEAEPPSDDMPAAVDVAVIGAGFFGLSCALRLAESGLSVAVIEKGRVGAGASGRNGGQVQAGFGTDPGALAAGAGPEQEAEIREIAATCADRVFDLAARHEIACDPVRAGLIRGVHHTRLVEKMRAKAEADPALEWWSAGRTAEALGMPHFHGAIFDPRAGRIEPMGFARGLARAARSHGAKLVTGTPVQALARAGGGWRIDTAKGSLQAGSAVLATNTYTDAVNRTVQQSLVAVNSFQIATEPFEGGPLSGGQIASDTRRLVYYFRRDAEGRLIVGGRGTLSGTDDLRRYGFLQDWIKHSFPGQARLKLSHYWAGRVGITPDHVPHFHIPADGLFILCGFNGKGVALATALGERLARHIAGEPPSVLGLPARPLRPIPFWRFRNLGVSAHVALYRLLDRHGR